MTRRENSLFRARSQTFENLFIKWAGKNDSKFVQPTTQYSNAGKGSYKTGAQRIQFILKTITLLESIQKIAKTSIGKTLKNVEP